MIKSCKIQTKKQGGLGKTPLQLQLLNIVIYYSLTAFYELSAE